MDEKDMINSEPTGSTKLTQLSAGLLMASMKRQNNEPHYSVLDQVTHTTRLAQERRSYCGEIERVLLELELTATLLSEVKNDSSDGRVPEEVINYYNGVYLTLVHQLKDKLFRLIDLMVVEEPLKKAYNSPDTIKAGKFLTKHDELLKKIGIREFLGQWDSEGSTSISIVLKRRTQHHHFVSRLPLNEDFQKIKLSKLMLGDSVVSQLSEYGKEKMTQLGKESFTSWRQDILDKQALTTQNIKENIDAIAERLVSYYRLPVSSEEHVVIYKKWEEVQDSLKIRNSATLPKTGTVQDKWVKVAISAHKKFLSDRLISVYLVGSCARDEFLPGISNVNLYFITKGEVDFPFEAPRSAIIYLSEEEFLSDEHAKDRFICWSDGVLFEGKKHEFKAADFPKPGTLLALFLNRDFEKRLDEIRQEVKMLKDPTDEELRPYCIEVSRIMMDFVFGVAMANKPFYSASRAEKIKHAKRQFPTDKSISVIDQAYRSAIIKQEVFGDTIDSFLVNARKSFEKMLAVEREIAAQREKRP